MTRIRYVEGDPRAGRVVELEPGLAKRFIEAGVAQEVSADTKTTDATDIPTDDGSAGDGRREGRDPNAGPEATTSRTAEGAGDEDDPDKAGTGGTADKSVAATSNKTATKTAAKTTTRRR